MAKDYQSTKYFCTFNNPEKYGYDYTVIKKTLFEKFKTFQYCAMCTEVAHTGTKHYHVYMHFTSRVRWSTVTNHFKHADVQKAMGTTSQCIAYIKKDGKWENNEEKQHTVVKGSFEEFGERPSDKKENDSAELLRMIQEGYTNSEIFAENSEYIKQASIIDKIRFDIKSEEISGKRRLNLEVVYVQGSTGTGKSRHILDTYGDENVCRITRYNNHPFDHYKFQDVLVFEEFRNSVELKQMLNYCDIYPIDLPARYAPKPLFATKIFIISNWNLEKQYEEEQVTDMESYEAFLRRIHKVKIFNDDGSITTYNSVDEYMKENVKPFNFSPITDEEFNKIFKRQ